MRWPRKSFSWTVWTREAAASRERPMRTPDQATAAFAARSIGAGSGSGVITGSEPSMRSVKRPEMAAAKLVMRRNAGSRRTAAMAIGIASENVSIRQLTTSVLPSKATMMGEMAAVSGRPRTVESRTSAPTPWAKRRKRKPRLRHVMGFARRVFIRCHCQGRPGSRANGSGGMAVPIEGVGLEPVQVRDDAPAVHGRDQHRDADQGERQRPEDRCRDDERYQVGEPERE